MSINWGNIVWCIGSRNNIGNSGTSERPRVYLSVLDSLLTIICSSMWMYTTVSTFLDFLIGLYNLWEFIDDITAIHGALLTRKIVFKNLNLIITTYVFLTPERLSHFMFSVFTPLYTRNVILRMDLWGGKLWSEMLVWGVGEGVWRCGVYV